MAVSFITMPHRGEYRNYMTTNVAYGKVGYQQKSLLLPASNMAVRVAYVVFTIHPFYKLRSWLSPNITSLYSRYVYQLITTLLR